MSTLEEKLSNVAPRSDDRARQTLHQLRTSWGRLSVVEGTQEKPLVMLRMSMGDVQRWRKESGEGSKSMWVLEREG